MTSSSQATRWGVLRGSPRNLRAPTTDKPSSSSGRGCESRSVIVRDPSVGADVCALPWVVVMVDVEQGQYSSMSGIIRDYAVHLPYISRKHVISWSISLLSMRHNYNIVEKCGMISYNECDTNSTNCPNMMQRNEKDARYATINAAKGWS